jgi:A/G-specific adenine glycosylase
MVVEGRTVARDAARAPFERELRRWYRRHHRPMPWRRTRDPYRIWVSEVMLQQTQVTTATPFYQRFVARFPTPRALADAAPADVLALWAGLGYYRRARFLHEAARVVAREHSGRVPDDPEAFAKLPGVGRYTTGAVQSIAFDRPLAVLDGNVARVLSRIYALQDSVRDPKGARRLWALAESLVPMRAPGEWNQALMELGATVCTFRSPACGSCPLRKHCRAAALGTPEAFPRQAVRRATERVRRAIALVERRGAVLVARRSGTLLDRMWEPPGVDAAASPAATRRRLERELSRLGVTATLARTEHVLRHRITHRAIEVEVWRGTTAHMPRRQGLRFAAPGDAGVAFTALGRRAAELARRVR